MATNSRTRILTRSTCLLVLIVLCGITSTCFAEQKHQRPNILFALSDDQSWLHTSFAGEAALSTPNFDRLAREGTYFTHCFSACPSCTPSRSAILSGQDIWRLRQAGVLYGSMPADIRLFTHALEDNGYHIGYTGKGWVPGNPSALGLKRNPIGKEYNSVIDKLVARGLNSQDYAENFRIFMADRTAGSPFFFWFGCKEPHRVYENGIGKRVGKKTSTVTVPDFFPDTELIRSDILDYCVEIEWFDRHLGKMLHILEEAGELENTIVVVTSDNGMPFPRCKTTLYDWGVRMPLAIRWGKQMTAGRRIDDFVSLTDIAPTLLEAAGLPVPTQMSGRSLLKILKSAKQGRLESNRDHVYTAMERHTWCRPDGATYPSRAIRTYDYLYIRNFQPNRWPTGGPSFVSSNKTFHGDVDACPTKTFLVENEARFPREFQLCFGKRPLEELYAVNDDPGQTRNLAKDPNYSNIKAELWNRLSKYLRKTGDPRISGHDPWQHYIYHQTTGFGAVFNLSLTQEQRRLARERAAHKPE